MIIGEVECCQHDLLSSLALFMLILVATIVIRRRDKLFFFLAKYARDLKLLDSAQSIVSTSIV